MGHRAPWIVAIAGAAACTFGSAAGGGSAASEGDDATASTDGTSAPNADDDADPTAASADGTSATTGVPTTGSATSDGVTDGSGDTSGDCEGGRPWYPDGDGDGFGDSGAAWRRCGDPPPGHVDVGGDCDDGDDAINPGADELCNDIDDDCDGGIDEGSPANLACDGCEFVLADDGGSYFAWCPGPIDWMEARTFCGAFGPGVDLAIIDAPADQTTLLDLVTGDAWIGLSDLGRTDHWVWVDGSDAIVGGAVVGYDGWAPNQPDGSGVEHCGELDPFDDGWQDVDCGQDQALLCRHPL